MRFMVLVKSDAKAEAGVLPDEQLLSEMGKYNEELAKVGMILGADGLRASSRGARVRSSGGKVTVIDGPFAEAKELVAGYWLLQAKSKADAVEWLQRAPFQEGEVEVRPLYELDDFPIDASEKPDGWREAEAQARQAPPPARLPGTKRFMVFVKSDKNSEAGALPDEKSLTDMGALMDELIRSGAMLAGEGLKPSSLGARIHYSGSKRTVVDGPFTETKELLAGYCIIQVKSKTEAVEFAKRWLRVHVDAARVPESEIEVRELFELEDYPVDAAEKPGGWRDQEQAVRARLG